MKVLVTGCAGFIGFHLSLNLIKSGFTVYGVDNLNNYYDVNLKKSRLSFLESNYPQFHFIKTDLANKDEVIEVFRKQKYEYVVHLAAQAGVRFSLKEPMQYIYSNILGFQNILEEVRKLKPRHFIFASSSSVYGMQNKIPYSESDNTDSPVSLYAATKKSNELVAYSYSHLYDIRTTALRFFTVYGTYGRPDMAYFRFTDSILNEKEINIFNKGELSRDFTHIDDITEPIKKLLQLNFTKKFNANEENKFKVFNLGNGNPVKLLDFLECIENACGKRAKVNFIDMQKGDVFHTHADITNINDFIEYSPKVSIENGISEFVEWYKSYYGK